MGVILQLFAIKKIRFSTSEALVQQVGRRATDQFVQKQKSPPNEAGQFRKKAHKTLEYKFFRFFKSG